MMRSYPRAHPLWLAFVLHRVSGLALALFLPVHFLVLSMALTRPQELDAFLVFAEAPLLRLAEGGLVFLLAVHAFGGLRLMALEWLPWRDGHKTLAAVVVAAALLVSGGFLLRVV